MKYIVSYRSELYEAGISEDGSMVTGYAHTVMVEAANGQRFLLETSTVHDTEVKHGRVYNTSTEAIKLTEKRAKKVEKHLNAGGLLDPQYWDETYPDYCSDRQSHIPMTEHDIFLK